VELFFLVILIGALVAGVCVLGVMGVRRWRRRRMLVRTASSLGLSFSVADRSDLPRRFGRFALLSAGHSQRAENVLLGRWGRRRVRAFDYRYEIGHGAARQTLRCWVVLAEGQPPPQPGESLLLWRGESLAEAPLGPRDCRRRCKGKAWAVGSGDSRRAEALADVLPAGDEPAADRPDTVQIHGGEALVGYVRPLAGERMAEAISVAVAAADAAGI
jgi:hypothetical protein